MNKKLIVFAGLAVLAFVGMIMGIMCIERIPAGYVGVQYSVKGGVKDELLTQGWHIVSPTIKVTEYSIATEQLNMTAEDKEDFDVICSDGKMNIDIEMSYSFDTNHVAAVYQKYRGLDGEEVINNIVRGKIKTKISEVTSNYSVLDAYMEKKAELNADITATLQEYLLDFGVTVESCNITRASVDDSIMTAITERSRVAQELEVEKMNQEKAKLQAETALITAQGQNDVMIANAKAEAEAYKIKTEEITPELLQKWLIEKWNGQLPVFAGENGEMMLDVSDLMN